MSGDGALARLASELREADEIGPLVTDAAEEPALGRLAASGPRAAGDAGEYTLLFESIREGYLLHYGEPRLLDGVDSDLRLLAGDFLYALGLERLAALGDLEAVRELGDLISLSAALAEEGGDDAATDALWLAAAVTVGAGPTSEHEEAKAALRVGDPGAVPMLDRSMRTLAEREGMAHSLAEASNSIGFAAQDPDRG